MTHDSYDLRFTFRLGETPFDDVADIESDPRWKPEILEKVWAAVQIAFREQFPERYEATKHLYENKEPT